MYLIDTPGFDNPSRSDVSVLRDIATWLAASYSEGVRLSAVLYLHRITDVRVGGAAKRNLAVFKRLVGKEAMRNVVLVSTMWDRLGVHEGRGEERERELIETPGLWGWMVEKGAETGRWSASRGREEARMIIGRIVNNQGSKEAMVLDMQKQMIEHDRSLDETSAGMELERDAHHERKRHQDELRDMRRGMQREQDEELRDQMRQAMEVHSARVDELKKVKEELRALREREVEELDNRLRILGESQDGDGGDGADEREMVRMVYEPVTQVGVSFWFLVFSFFDLYAGWVCE